MIEIEILIVGGVIRYGEEPDKISMNSIYELFLTKDYNC